MTTLPVSVVTTLLVTVRRMPWPKNCGVCSTSPSTPRNLSVRIIVERPNVIFLSEAVGSAMAIVVRPANLAPANGTISRSVCASAACGASSRNKIVSVLPNK